MEVEGEEDSTDTEDMDWTSNEGLREVINLVDVNSPLNQPTEIDQIKDTLLHSSLLSQ